MSMAGHERLIDEYTLAMQMVRYAPGTISTRVRVATNWLQHSGAHWYVATWREIEAYGGTRAVCGATWRDEVSHLSHFYKWAMRMDYAEADPTVLVERPRVGMRQPRPVTPTQYLRLVDGADPQMRAIIDLMAWVGLRCCEVARLRWSDIDLIERTAIVQGKGNRERTISLPRKVIRALVAIDAATELVFLSPKGAALSPARVSQMVGEWCRHQRVPVTAHQLRHKYATFLLEAADGDLLIVQEALGHASVATTQIYAQVSRLRAKQIAKILDAILDADEGRLFE